MYLVTTHPHRIPTDRPIVMVDGTVPGWTPKPGDRHYDHHRPGGADIQIDEIPSTHPLTPSSTPPTCFVTTMTDADACCAAAWVQTSPDLLSDEIVAKLRAIAWDCDHLAVPKELEPYATFASKAVAAMKRANSAMARELHLPVNKKEWTEEDWERYSSLGFERGTEWLLASIKGDRPFPGEQGEADDYWQSIEADARMLLAEGRISFLETETGVVALCDVRGLNRAMDPRAFYHALSSPSLPHSISSLRPETLTIRDHRIGGIQYTLGSIPLHPGQKRLDFTAGTFDRLTQIERAIAPDADPWGGRRTVGGSGWNTSCRLTPEQVVQLL